MAIKPYRIRLETNEDSGSVWVDDEKVFIGHSDQPRVHRSDQGLHVGLPIPNARHVDEGGELLVYMENGHPHLGTADMAEQRWLRLFGNKSSEIGPYANGHTSTVDRTTALMGMRGASLEMKVSDTGFADATLAPMGGWTADDFENAHGKVMLLSVNARRNARMYGRVKLVTTVKDASIRADLVDEHCARGLLELGNRALVRAKSSEDAVWYRNPVEVDPGTLVKDIERLRLSSERTYGGVW